MSAERQRKFRERNRGKTTITIMLEPNEVKFLEYCMSLSSKHLEDLTTWRKNALFSGAMMWANAGSNKKVTKENKEALLSNGRVN
jgi:hypothetical protein